MAMFPLIIFIMIMTARSEVLVGFEVELPDVMVKKEALPSKALIDKKTWRLFTDMSDETGYTLEFATTYGFNREQIVLIADEMQGAMITMINSIGVNANKIFKSDAYMKLIYALSTNMEILNKVDTNYREKLNDKDITIRSLKKLILWFTTALVDSKMIMAKESEVMVENLNRKIKEEIKKQIIKIDTDIRELQVKMDKSLKKSLYFDLIKLRQDKRDVERFVTRKYYMNFISDKINKIWKDEKWFNQHLKDEFLKNARNNDFKNEPNVLKAVEALIKNFGFISNQFYKRDKNLPVNNKFEPFCSFKMFKYQNKMKVAICTPSTVRAFVQLTYQFPISAYKNLIKYYASYSYYLNDEEHIGKLEDSGIPSSLVILSNIIYNNVKPSVNTIYYNPSFLHLWNADMKSSMDKHINTLYNSQSNDRQAEGLFYMFMSYAMILFNRPEDKSSIEIFESKMVYGPYKYCP